MRKEICSLTALLITCTAHSMLIVFHLQKNITCRLQPIIMPPTTIMLVANCHPYCNSYCQSYCSVSCNITLQLQRQRGRTAQHEFQETCHSITSYFMKKTPNDAVTPQRQSQFTPKMKANAVPHLLSSQVRIE